MQINDALLSCLCTSHYSGEALLPVYQSVFINREATRIFIPAEPGDVFSCLIGEEASACESIMTSDVKKIGDVMGMSFTSSYGSKSIVVCYSTQFNLYETLIE